MLPLAGLVVVGSIPLVGYARKTAAERDAADALGGVHAAQEAFRNAGGRGGYASQVDSLATPCEGAAPSLPPALVREVAAIRYRLVVRPAVDASPAGVDCHGRPVVSDYYAAVHPDGADAPGQRAFAARADGRIYLFYDGVPPAERDMGEGGLATPLDAAAEFRIP
jgi:hypothetical protein